LGAPSSLVFRQVLLESLLVAAAGGFLGCLVGLVPSLIPSGTLPWQPQLALVDLLVAVGLALGVGVVAGILPAWKASRLDPVEAMRS
jgi:putative ABC transport system permease protein